MNRAEVIDAIMGALVARDLERAHALITELPPDCEDVAARAQAAIARVAGGGLVTPPAPASAPASRPARQIREGRYTVVNRETGNHRTYLITRQAPDDDFMPGRLIVALLDGPDNEADYTSVGVVSERGDRVWLWKRLRDSPSLLSDVAVLEGDPDACAGAYATESGNCPRCGKVLTHPASIYSQIGPTCSEKWGWPYSDPPSGWEPDRPVPAATEEEDC